MNKKLLGKSGLLEILIDSESFNKELNKESEDAKKILRYSKSEFLRFIRSPSITNFKELQIIPEFIKKYNENDLPIIEIISDSERSTTVFGYDIEYIKYIGQNLFNKTLNGYEIELLTLIFIHADLNQFNRDNTHILITNNEFLLKNRLLVYQHTYLSHDIIDHLHIVTIKEAIELIGLFLKFQNKYTMSADPLHKAQYNCNRGLWYWYSFRSKIPNFHVGALINEPFLDAFSSRFVYLLRSVDEIGFQYYMGVNNDTLDNMMYHFNYSISLITGIFDALATITKNKYELQFRGDDIPQRTSLNPKAGRDFLRAVRENNIELREHIQSNVNIIKLVYELRELVIHGKLLGKTRFSHKDIWKMNAIKIDKSILDYFSSNDKMQKYKPITEWGVYKLNNDNILLEPFEFSKMILKILIPFSNEYLRMLGFNSFIEELKNENPNDDFIRGIELFKEGSLDLF